MNKRKSSELQKMIDTAPVSSQYEFGRKLNLIIDEIEKHNFYNNDNIDYQDFVENIIEKREEFFKNNIEIEKEKFYEKIARVHSNNIMDTEQNKNSIRVVVDSVTGTLKIVKNNCFFSDVLMGYKSEFQEIFEGEFIFARQTFRKKIISNGLIFYRDRLNKKTGEIEDIIYISWMGENIKQLEYILNEHKLNMLDFLKMLYEMEFGITRLDIAFDDLNSDYFDIKKIGRKVKYSEYKSTFKNKPVHYNDFETIYFGMGTDLQLRIYDKRRETIDNNKLYALESIIDDLPNWCRMELQLRRKYAEECLKDIYYYRDEENVIGEVGRAWVCKKITFLSQGKTKSNRKSLMVIAPFWKEFSNVKLEVRATFERQKLTIENSIDHIIRQARSISAIRFLKEYDEKYGLVDSEISKKIKEAFEYKYFDDAIDVGAEMYERLITLAQTTKDENLIREIRDKICKPNGSYDQFEKNEYFKSVFNSIREWHKIAFEVETEKFKEKEIRLRNL